MNRHWAACFVTTLSLAVTASLFASAVRAKGAAISDRQITSAIGRRFLADDEIPAELIDIQTADGIVTLSGTADNALEKDRAADIAETLKGVRTVINDIHVEPVQRDDKLIRTDIQDALLDDPATAELEVRVSVSHAIATLTGQVGSGILRRLAQEVAEGVIGVGEVKNDLAISGSGNPVPDDQLAAEVRDRLTYDLWLNPSLIDVHAQQGTIKLTGSVASLYQKNRAIRNAWIQGVRSVDSSGLAVSGWPATSAQRSPTSLPDDAAIRKAIEAAFREDPRAQSFKLAVDVVGGHVTLSGAVDNLKARRAAEEDAQDTVGVIDVDNDLKVRMSAPLTTDEALTQKVRAALRRDIYLDQSTIRVYVRHGLVYLYGGTGSQFEKEWAAEVVSRIRGVVAVRNRIVPSYIRPPMSNSELKDNIEWYWFWNPTIHSSRLHVSVQDSMATVSGTEPTVAEKRDAIRDAYKAGALNVFDRIKLEP